MELKLSDKIAWRKIDKSVYVVTTADSHLHSLNEIGSFIWELINKGKNKKDIMENICNEYEVDSHEAENDLDEFIKQMKEKKIIL